MSYKPPSKLELASSASIIIFQNLLGIYHSALMLRSSSFFWRC